MLLTGDAQLRDLAGAEQVECHGVLWVLDRMEDADEPGVHLLRDELVAVSRHPRCRLPRREITIRLERYDMRIERRG